VKISVREIFFISLALSLLMHLSFFGTMNLLFKKNSKLQNTGPIEISVVPQKESSRQSFVRELPKFKEDKALKNQPADFLSKETRRVERQQVAKSSGQLTPPIQAKQSNQPNKNTENNSDTQTSSNEAGDFKPKSPYAKPYTFTPLVNTSNARSLGPVLPQVTAQGDFTALNTDKFQYYSFFERIENSIRYPWEQSVYRSILSLSDIEKKSLSNIEWVTQVEVFLDPSGKVEKTILMKGSGHFPFDQAAAKAFESAKVFPNPPSDLIEEDGYIHLKYSFHVRFLKN
jgi:TonB family protein